MMHTNIRTHTYANATIQRWRTTNTGHLCPIFAFTCAASKAREGGSWRQSSGDLSHLLRHVFSLLKKVVIILISYFFYTLRGVRDGGG